MLYGTEKCGKFPQLISAFAQSIGTLSFLLKQNDEFEFILRLRVMMESACGSLEFLSVFHASARSIPVIGL
jgi:hypothetical protein